MKKYSIVLPTFNNAKYIKECINSFLFQKFDNFELIVSNNISTDETADILNNYSDPRLKVIQPPVHMDHMDHWNFAVSQAHGEWIFTLGADDAVLPYFFEFLEYLTKIADKKKIDIIKCTRAYYFYEGLSTFYNDSFVNFYATEKMEVKSTKKALLNAFKSESEFYEIPQMYTTAIFRNTILEKIINFSTDDRIFPKNSWGQDAVMGIYACIFAKKYLLTSIPFGWVGSSPSSAGLSDGKAKLVDIKDFTTDNPYKTVNSTIQLLYYNLKKVSATLPNKIIPAYISKVLNNPAFIYTNVYLERILKNSNKDADLRIIPLEQYINYNKLNFDKIKKMAEIKYRKEINAEKFHINNLPARLKNNRCTRFYNSKIKKTNTFGLNLKQKNFEPYSKINSLIISADSIKKILSHLD